jgi:hypothetical protein
MVPTFRLRPFMARQLSNYFYLTSVEEKASYAKTIQFLKDKEAKK